MSGVKEILGLPSGLPSGLRTTGKNLSRKILDGSVHGDTATGIAGRGEDTEAQVEEETEIVIGEAADITMRMDTVENETAAEAEGGETMDTEGGIAVAAGVMRDESRETGMGNVSAQILAGMLMSPETTVTAAGTRYRIAGLPTSQRDSRHNMRNLLYMILLALIQ